MTQSPSFDEIFEEEKQQILPQDHDSFELVDEEDKWIFMHRDAHFSGSFSWMIEYYENDGVGVHPDISLDRIKALFLMEKSHQSNLAPLFLGSREADRISQAKEAYKNLKELYDKHAEESIPVLLANLILSESEDCLSEARALADKGEEVSSVLLQTMNSDTFLDTLGPGYGLAPLRILKVLRLIKDPNNVPEIFSIFNRDILEDEQPVIDCLKATFDTSLSYLEKVLNSSPIKADNEKAAYALVAFQDPKASLVCLNYLEENLDNISMYQQLVSYCVLGCEQLQDKDEQKRFIDLDRRIPEELKEDFMLIAKSFSSEG